MANVSLVIEEPRADPFRGLRKHRFNSAPAFKSLDACEDAFADNLVWHDINPELPNINPITSSGFNPINDMKRTNAHSRLIWLMFSLPVTTWCLFKSAIN